MLTNKIKYYIIGHSKYSFDGNEGLRMNCIDDYDLADKDNGGSFVSSINAPYEDASKLQAVEMSLFKPAIVEFDGKTVRRGNNTVLIASAVVSVTPYDEWNKQSDSKAPINKSVAK
jgi:hypothetical protein